MSLNKVWIVDVIRLRDDGCLEVLTAVSNSGARLRLERVEIGAQNKGIGN